ncbi:hypothetical protein SCYAM73S_07796 [Streptomyces cyaneofuscatus]
MDSLALGADLEPATGRRRTLHRDTRQPRGDDADRRPPRHGPGDAPRGLRPHRSQEGLRPRPVRSLHGFCRRAAHGQQHHRPRLQPGSRQGTPAVSPRRSALTRNGSPWSPSTSAAASARRAPPVPRGSWPRWPAQYTGHPVKLALPSGPSSPRSSDTWPPRSSGSGSARTLDGLLTAVSHEVVYPDLHGEGVRRAGRRARPRHVRLSPNSRTGHRVVALDVPTPSWMRAPGRPRGCTPWSPPWTNSPSALGLDPVELRLRNEPADRTGQRPPLQQPRSRRLPARRRRHGSAGTTATPAPPPGRKDGGSSVRAWPPRRTPFSSLRVALASAHAAPDGSLTIRVNATDIGTRALHRPGPDRRRRARHRPRGRPHRYRLFTGTAHRPAGLRLLRHRLLGLGRAQGSPPTSPPASPHTPGLLPAEGIATYRRHRAGDRRGVPVRPARLRRPLRRDGRRRRHRRGARPPPPRGVRRRTHPQRAHRPIPVHRRHGDGHRHGPHRGLRHRPGLRRLHGQGPRFLPRARLRRHRRHPGPLDRGGRPPPQPHGQQGHRRDRDRRARLLPSATRSATPPAPGCASCPSPRTPCCPTCCDRAPAPTSTHGPAVARPAYRPHPEE